MGNNVASPLVVDTVTRIWFYSDKEILNHPASLMRKEKIFSYSLGLPIEFTVITLKHHESGNRKVYVNNKLVHEGHTSFDSVEVAFDLFPNQSDSTLQNTSSNTDSLTSLLNAKGKIKIIFNNSFTDHTWTYRYECYVNDSPLKEINDIIDPLISDRDPNEISVSIPSTKVDEASKVVWYEIRAKIKGYDKDFQVYHRFKDFDLLHEDIRSCFIGTHMLSSLPSLPSKHLKLFSDHLDPEFIEERRKSLEIYLKKLVKLPRVSINPYIRIFIGVTEQYSDKNVSTDTQAKSADSSFVPPPKINNLADNPFVSAAAAAKSTPQISSNSNGKNISNPTTQPIQQQQLPIIPSNTGVENNIPLGGEETTEILLNDDSSSKNDDSLGQFV